MYFYNIEKMQSTKIFFKKGLVFSVIPVFLVFFSIAYAQNSTVFIDAQKASGSGSNNSMIQIFSWSLQYINVWNNSTVIGNSFSGTYYDSVYGIFKTKWSDNPAQNVRVIGSTSACGVGNYGYKLWGFAYSETSWFINFAPTSSVFVYYCENEKQLRGFAYSKHLGFQNFSGIGFDINHIDAPDPEISEENDTFTNTQTEIFTPPSLPWSSQTLPGSSWDEWTESSWTNTNTQGPVLRPPTIDGQKIEFLPENESLFYIIK